MQVSVDSSAEYKTYITGFTMDYKDENNQDQSTTFSVGIPVTGSINLDIIKIEPDYQRQRIEVEVANKGTTDATSVEARLIIDNETLDVDYTSSIRATKKTTFDFPLVLQGRGQLVIDYTGPGIKKNQETMDVILDFVPQGGDGTTTLLVLAIIVIAIVGWRKKWHHKIWLFKKKQ
jgi:subtilase family serine protease